MTGTLRLLALAAAATLGFTGVAFAHAHLKSSTPAAGGTMATPPTEIDLTFTEDVNLKFTGIELTGPDKKVVPTGDGMLMAKDTMLMAPIIGTIHEGTYKVAWHALSKDGHKTSGTFTFTVKP